MQDNTLLVSLSRQVALRRQMDVIANNLANLETGGFKSSDVLFEEYLMPKAEASDALPGDRDISYVIDRGTLQDFAPGPIQQTGNPLDVAIDGEGWFVVQTPAGERYTRNGAFLLDNEGALVTAEGHRVMGDGGVITFDERDGAVAIAADGTVSTKAGEKGRLRVAVFDDDAILQPEGSSLFSAPVQPQTANDATVRQGMVEGSNVQPIVEMTRMIEVTRAYTSLSSMLERMDDMRRNAISVLAVIQ
ncbi:flagellar basal-body rod protein FlgF [Microbaculum marinisediminis]|uniref:Flagellar basal-body rod protein FlgF n=1 Tax=Microbaculum marinisediminis TaxID=2931392 RepID=A0AAW5QY18_9HYPH|nr:flagellar basal-body rod protein FlgF [Microbaculum sp. A6E488]MCT8972827.1 flagellar basal-body rod protein FlgF [Microbaculum sp. A6E488]